MGVSTGKPLRTNISEVVVKYLKKKMATGEQIDVAEMTHDMAQCLVDVIMEQEEEGQGTLFAYALASLGEEYLKRRGLLDTKVRGH